jgi:DNA repair protein RecN (Recombination protein N)
MNAKETELQVETLENAEEIQTVLQGALHLLDGAEGIATRLHTLQQQLQKISRYGNEYALLADRIKALMIEAKDITGDVEGLADQAQSNPQLLSELQEKMGEIYRLQQKHRVQDLDELLTLKDTWQSQLEGLGNAEEEIAQLEKEIQETEKQLLKTGALISQRRTEAGTTLETELAQWLKQLSMEHAKIQVELKACSPKSDGCDDVQILFTANKGMTPQAIQQTASGGEISRVMLALKAVMASRQNLPAMILDEIDQGVSGDVGLKMGQLLQKCASQMQVIAISHLPQVASKANHHFKVFKEHGDQRTLTKVLALDHPQRIQEIAEMLSGKTPTAAAIANAEDLLKA